MKQILKPLADEVKKVGGEFGFKGRGSLLVKRDALNRGIQLDLLNSKPGAASFDLLFDLGIPGLEGFAAKGRKWVVRASGRSFPLDEAPLSTEFEITGTADDEKVIANASICVRRACAQFLLKIKDPDDLFRFVKDSAFSFVEHGPELHDDFWRMHLWPWNAMARLELAGVYAVFLGFGEEAELVKSTAVEFATGRRKNLDYLIPKIQESMSLAEEIRDTVSSG